MREDTFDEGTTDLEVGKEGFFVENGGLETEGVDNVVDLGLTLLERFASLLRGRVGTDVDIVSRANDDHRAVDLVDNSIDFFSGWGVRTMYFDLHR